MAGTLREELASLKIDRPSPVKSGGKGHSKPTVRHSRSRGGGVLRFISWFLWMIPLGLLGVAGSYGYRQYDQIRSRVEVTIGRVSQKTWADASTLLDANGYLKSRYQAMIGTKVAGRVEEMRVVEGDKVKKGDTLAIIEHNDMKAMLASREAQAQRTAAELEEERAELWAREREDLRVDQALQPEERHSRGTRESPGRTQEVVGASCRARSGCEVHAVQYRRDQGHDRDHAPLRAI